MIDPRFANAGAVPFAPGYGAQQGPQYYHHHRHHRHHKHKSRNDDSPVSRDESIHKVDHSQPHHFHQQDGAQFGGGGFGVPYGAGAGFQQQQYGGGNFGYANQYQGQFAGGPTGQTVKHHRHHRHHRHHTVESGQGGADQSHAVPEQLIGQRSSSVLGADQRPAHSPVSVGEGGTFKQHRHHRRHHRHHHHSGEHAEVGHTHHSGHSHHRTSSGGDGYGHINDELIFIERGDQSPHRQEPPAGYEYKGKIEVQGFEKQQQQQQRSQTFIPPGPPQPPLPQPISSGPCPPGWQQMVLTAGGSCGPCPPGGLPYTGQVVGSGVAQSGISGFSSGTGFSGLGGLGPLPPNCQVVADYVVGASAGGYQQSNQTNCFTGQHQQSEFSNTTRPTIIEVWQKRSKSPGRERSGSGHRTRTPGPDFDFERFRNEILQAIERILARAPAETHGTQTQIRPETRVVETKHEAGEVRVIVQPIQPVFYMPRPGATTPSIGPAAPQTTSGGAPNVVYVPRNVYVPVIKPVFVPRERVIVRPQVIHVARPVLVDRPVPVTQRPIIIDRERPVPVPVRTAAAAQAGGSKVVREEYVYRDNLPVAYGGRCEEFSGGANYGYTAAQGNQFASSSAQGNQYASSSGQENQYASSSGQENQYASSSVQESASVYQAGGQAAQIVTAGQVEVLDSTINPNWQRTDQSSLARRYGRPAVEIVHQSKEVEQQMYNEIRQRSSSGVDIRSASSASYASGSGIGLGDGCIGQY